jgi:outer membrane protein
MMGLKTHSCFSKARSILRAFCCFSVLLISDNIARAQTAPTEQELTAYANSTEAQKTKLLLDLASIGDHDFAEVLLAKYPLQGKFALSRTEFVKGLIQRARGDLTGAAKTFRKILARDPDLTRVRAELARTLVALDEDDSAKHHLELLAGSAPDEQQAAGVRTFIDKIDAKRPFTMNGYFSLAPSSNVNVASSNEKIYLPYDGQIQEFKTEKQKSGIGLVAGASAGYTRRLGNDFVGVLSGGVNGRIYKERKFDQFSASQSAELRYITDRGFLSFGAVASEGKGANNFEIDSLSYGPRVALSHSITPQLRVNTSVVHEWRNNTNDRLDGTAILVDNSLSFALTSTSTISLQGGFDFVKTQEKDFGTTTKSVGLSIYKELPQGITLGADAQAAFADYHANHALLTYKRKDKRFSGNLSLTKRDLNILGFAPTLTYSYVHNSSNVDLYDHNIHAVDLRFTKKF